MKQQIVCLVARQRSGTTALRANLAATGRLHDFGEILPVGAIKAQGSFLGFCRDRQVLFNDAVDPEQLPALCTDYIDRLRQIAGGKHVLVDVKFNHWGTVRPAWSYIHEEPFFLQFLKKQDALFVFIRRESLVDQILSSHIARARDQWQNLGSDASAPATEINVARAAREALLIRQSETFLWGRLQSYPRRLHFVYEELFVDGNLVLEAQGDISRELGEDLKFPAASPIKKNKIDKQANVKNYEEARLAIERATGTVAGVTKS